MKRKRFIACGIASLLAVGMFAFSGMTAEAAEAANLPSYRTVTEVYDWGPAVSKVIVDLGREVKSGEVDTSTFKVYARRVLAEGATPLGQTAKDQGRIELGAKAKANSDVEGYREVTRAYVSDAEGRPAEQGR